jgi:cephalosporin hydroxylase
MVTIEQALEQYRKDTPDIAEHLDTLVELSSRVSTVVEFGFRHGASFCALLKGLGGRPGTSIATFDINIDPRDVDFFVPLRGETDLEFNQISTLEAVPIEPVELFFCDTLHTYKQLKAELARHAKNVTKYIVLHDTVSYAHKGEDGSDKGLRDAIIEYIADRPEWSIEMDYQNNNGLMVCVKDSNYEKKSAI